MDTRTKVTKIPKEITRKLNVTSTIIVKLENVMFLRALFLAASSLVWELSHFENQYDMWFIPATDLKLMVAKYSGYLPLYTIRRIYQVY